MRKLIDQQEIKKPRTFKLTDKTWAKFEKFKSREKTWELFFRELTDVINYFRNIDK